MQAICLHNGTVLSGFAGMESCSVLIEDGRVADVFSERRFAQKKIAPGTLIIEVNGAFIAPGFIDSHIHGFRGRGTEEADPEALIAMSESLAVFGVSAFCPTLYPEEPDKLVETLASLSKAVGREGGARIIGFHLEGPFISPARLGVQKPETLSPVDIDLMERLWKASGGHISNMTVAPELKGMRELALYCLKKEIVLQAGHTDATYENMVEGMQAGILHSTHLFNAMSRMHHRNPNAVGAILIHPEFSCEVIADGYHIHPDLFRLLLRDKPADKLVLVTDALKPTEQTAGPFIANGEAVHLEEGVFHRDVDGVIAGSSLTMARGVRNLMRFGMSMQDAVRAASANPAQVLKLKGQGSLIPGALADIVVFDKDVNVLLSMVGGKALKNEL
jgi:N-acetylglucosamine-6-phosphate deacetylase